MQNIRFQLISMLAVCITAVAFDVLVISGWFLSGICLLAGLSMAARWRWLSKAKRYVLIALFAKFGTTSIIGYGLSSFIESDMLGFSIRNPSAPADKFELAKLAENQLSWITQWNLLAYSNVESVAVAKFRAFPYTISEFDFNEKRLSIRQFD